MSTHALKTTSSRELHLRQMAFDSSWSPEEGKYKLASLHAHAPDEDVPWCSATGPDKLSWFSSLSTRAFAGKLPKRSHFIIHPCS